MADVLGEGVGCTVWSAGDGSQHGQSLGRDGHAMAAEEVGWVGHEGMWPEVLDLVKNLSLSNFSRVAIGGKRCREKYDH